MLDTEFENLLLDDNYVQYGGTSVQTPKSTTPLNVLKEVSVSSLKLPLVSHFDFQVHQQKLINRMVQRCSDQHGIVLIHSMGSGKTLSSLGIYNEIL